MLLLRRHPELGKFVVVTTLILLYLLSTPFVAGTMLQKLETPFAPGFSNNGAQAIVMLGGCTHFNSAEYDGDTVSRYSLELIRYAAHLHLLTGKPMQAAGAPRWATLLPKQKQHRCRRRWKRVFGFRSSGPRKPQTTRVKTLTGVLQC